MEIMLQLLGKGGDYNMFYLGSEESIGQIW